MLFHRVTLSVVWSLYRSSNWIRSYNYPVWNSEVWPLELIVISKRLNLVSIIRNDFSGAIDRANIWPAFRHRSDMISEQNYGIHLCLLVDPLVVLSVFILSWVKPASPKPWFYWKFGGRYSVRVIPITQFFARSDRISLHFVRMSSPLVGPPSTTFILVPILSHIFSPFVAAALAKLMRLFLNVIFIDLCYN
jgi:hypothetical protein